MKTIKIKKIGMFTKVLVSVISFISSCNKDDNDEFSIIGKWNVDRVTEIKKENGEVISHNIYNDIQATLTFNKDGTAVATEGDEYWEPALWSLIDDKLYWTWVEGSDAGLTTEWTLKIISPRKIELEYNRIQGNYEVIEISELIKI